MIKFRKEGDYIVATYSAQQELDWLFKKFEENDSQTLKGTFTFSKHDLYPSEETDDVRVPGISSFDVDFIFATLDGDYYKVKRGILVNGYDLYFHSSIKLKHTYFYYGSDISIFKLIQNVAKEDVWIGGDNANAIPLTVFQGMIARFPRPHERRLYLMSRVSSVIKEYFTTAIDGQQRLQKYVDKQLANHASPLPDQIHQNELLKFIAIRDKLLDMLDDTVGFSEHRWQNEILEIMLLIYPKYINVFKSVTIDAEGKKRQLDFILIDSNGNLDVIEVKKPFDDVIMARSPYRNNYIPFRELSGTIMQLEKYVYYLNRWGARGEKKLSEKYKDELPDGLEIKIVNPSGLIIMGREKGLTIDQKRDFEVVKRKYKNVVDILTYDCLIKRLNVTIEQMRKRKIT